MILLILLDAPLHTLMYFFLCNLPLVYFGSSSTVTPKVMTGLLTVSNVISYHAYAVPMSFFVFFVFFATVDSYLLASMAYDHHATVCKPVHNIATMTKAVCNFLVIDSYVFGILNVSIQTWDTFYLHFCIYNVINQFCDIPTLRVLAWSDKQMNEMILFFMSSLLIMFAFLVILTSYFLIWVFWWCIQVRDTRRLSHMCFSPHCSFHILWACHHNVLKAKFHSFHGHR